MSMEEFESIFNNVLLALQLLLGFWQFMKLTPVGALIKGVVAWLLQPFGLSPTYSRLHCLYGRVFKQARCFVLQEEIPSARRGVEAYSQDTLHLRYLGRLFLLDIRGSERNMLFIDGKMCYYITARIWEELQILNSSLNPDAADAAAAAADAAVADPDSLCYSSVFLKGQKEFWEGVSTGGVMTLAEVLDGLVLYNQHVSHRLNDVWVLPVNLSVSEEKLLKILNLLGLFLQTRKDNIHWLIPTSLSFISALMEFSTRLRKRLYSNINMLVCYILHSICNPLPLSWRRQVYSLGKWVENLKPSNDLQLKIERGNKRVIIAGGAKVDKESGDWVPWVDVEDEEYQFSCNSIVLKCRYYARVNTCHISAAKISSCNVECKSKNDFRHLITFVSCMAKNGCGSLKSCERNDNAFVRRFKQFLSIITFVSFREKDGCESLKFCGPNSNRVYVRGFQESIFSYVKSGFPPVYELELENVVFI